MAQNYAGLVDQYVYFPITEIPLKGDDMRPSDPTYQEAVDRNIHVALRELSIEPEKIHRLGAVAAHDRVAEILDIVT